jgi:hypothetical protein
VRTNFASVRDAVLAEHNWGFGTGFETPAEIAAPVAGWPGPYQHRFALSPDCLKVRHVEHAGANEWIVLSSVADASGSDAEIKVLATHLAAPKVVTTRRITNVRLWSPKFLEAFRHALASAVAPMVTGSTAKAEAENARADSAISDAALQDGKEMARHHVRRDTSWLRARRRGGARGAT